MVQAERSSLAGRLRPRLVSYPALDAETSGWGSSKLFTFLIYSRSFNSCKFYAIAFDTHENTQQLTAGRGVVLATATAKGFPDRIARYPPSWTKFCISRTSSRTIFQIPTRLKGELTRNHCGAQQALAAVPTRHWFQTRRLFEIVMRVHLHHGNFSTELIQLRPKTLTAFPILLLTMPPTTLLGASTPQSGLKFEQEWRKSPARD